MSYKIYTTYKLGLSGNTTVYNSETIHCGYVNSLDIEEFNGKEIGIRFDSVNDFKFLDNLGTSGFSANYIQILIQIVDSESKPTYDEWRIVDVTDQIPNHTVGNLIDKNNLALGYYKISLNLYSNMSIYTLDLGYPLANDTTTLCFGDESYFIGNVVADIYAKGFTTNIPIELNVNNFNYSTNKTWTDGSDIYITEIGIYDSNNNLVAVGKLNKPIKKNGNISKTIIFEIDF